MMTPPLPDDLISALLDGQLDEDQARELSDWVTATPEHARYIASLTVLERGLVQQCKKESAGNLLAELAEMEANAEIDGLVDLTEELKSRKRIAARADAKRRAQLARLGGSADAPRPFYLGPALAALGAVAALVLLAAFLYLRTTSTPPTGPIAHGTPQADPDGPVVLARVVDQHNIRWVRQHGQALPGEALVERQYTLARGSIELAMDGGGILIVKGPARFTLRDEGRVELSYGRVVSIVPAAAAQMRIQLPGVTLENNGAEFGCVATEEGVNRVDVFSGVVQAFSATDGLTRVSPGEAIEARGGRIDPVPAQPSGYVRDLARLHYQDAVLALGPVSYWPLLDDPASESIEDAVRGGLRLYARLAPLAKIAGPLGGDAMLFDGEGILDLAPDGLRTTDRYNQPRAFTFEAWVRPSEHDEPGYLIVANTLARTTSGWGFGVAPARDGVVPFLEVGSASWRFDDAELAVDRWTHLAITVDADTTARLYLDGREVDRQTGVTGPPHTPQYVHLAGRLLGERWRGGLAHAAFYDRAIAPDEIARHAGFANPARSPDPR